MKKILLVGAYALALAFPTFAAAQVAGSTLLGVTMVESRQIAEGYSVKHQILGKDVYNDLDEKIGSIDDIIVAGDKAVSYAIVNAGGFLALAKHDVAIPVAQFQVVEDKIVLPGATKEALTRTPTFEYAK